MSQGHLPPLPAELRSRAHNLSGELAWTAEDALVVIDLFEDSGVSIAGLELWEELEGHPRWIASVNFEPDREQTEEPDCRRFAAAARNFIVMHGDRNGALFNF